ncbi:MAG TPA: diguanylate cyclase [Solirubrobacteraceae bacterium]|nr:diguanylate cyclase [Solirubrobacteraceae bacterium]
MPPAIPRDPDGVALAEVKPFMGLSRLAALPNSRSMNLDVRSRMPLAASLAPFGAAATLTWVTVVIGTSIDWLLYAIATALLVLSGTLALLRERDIWHARAASIVSAMVLLGAVALLRSSAGGINSGVGVISLIPVFYVALLGEGRWQLYFVLAALAAFYLAPIVLVGPPAFPHTQYRAAALTIAVSAIIGLATQRLVWRARHEASEALSRERMLVQVNELVRRLSRSAEARSDICEAARTIGEACMAVIYEPIPGTEAMRSSAVVGADTGTIEISVQEPSAVSDAFLTGQASLITEHAEGHVGSVALWQAAGCPQSLLYEPLMIGSKTLGVLVVGWPARIKPQGTRATIVALLAHEAAAVIERADTLSQLTDMASTDPLTGLPNRRAWDARVDRALRIGEPFTIAMLDLDHFKQFNDARGHPAGDRLLKETAAIWRDQLRGGDMLARLGGEEFGLLLPDCECTVALEVIERLRSLVCEGQTCSAGFAERHADESAEQVLARADAALYEAKSAGRDRTCISR